MPEGVEVVGSDAADPTFTREVSAGASVVYNALNPPYDKWPELFPRLRPIALVITIWHDVKTLGKEDHR